ncbi:tRNA pseudouridine(55) synthase TruB [Arsenophonus endosymbiont of Lipoptena cervi]|uniref:tRNA pseudouridine(55) synthase TruB n=1 Tax=Arsenophonus endosymbiont of Lipoptena cervi TaxID=363258 RepID=UPI00376EEF2C
MRHQKGRDIHGILLLDKPVDISSNNALQKVRYLFNAKKAGHTGSLDPLASGMLPICLGNATKFSQYLLDSDKRYKVIARLGERTDTFDIYGKLICRRPIKINQTQLEKALDTFRGDLIQIPPMYSAIKHHGKPLYKYIRQGITIKRKGRLIKIYDLQCERWQKNELELTIHCSKGTYIRTLIDDLGEFLGCGANVIYLRRLQVGSYSIKNMVTMDNLYTIKQKTNEGIYLNKKLDSLLLPIDSAINHFCEVNVPYTISNFFKKGQSIIIHNNSFSKKMFKGMKVKVTEGDMHKFIGIAEIKEQNIITPIRLVFEN